MKIGKAVFKQGASNRIVTTQVQSLISNDNFWAIDHKRYQKQNWHQIFAQIEQISVSTLILDYNSHKTVLAEISHIRFYHLKELWLRENKISSIEDLACIEAPFLELLRISMNYIVKFKPLIKVQSRYINQMYIRTYFLTMKAANPINDFGAMTRVKFNNQMKDIFLQYWSHNNIIAEDLSFVVKLNAKSFHDLWIKGDRRVLQPVLYKKLKARYTRLNLYKNQPENQED